MKVLITGIDGFVGSHAAEMLIGLGGAAVQRGESLPSQASVDVHGTILRSGELPNISHFKKSLTLHQADISDAARVESIITAIQPDRILHIAGQAFVPASLQNPMETFQANLIGGLSVLEAAREQLLSTGKSPAVLVVSSGEVYGRVAPQQMPMTEQLPLAPNTPYSASKAALDLIAQQYAICFGVDVTIVRPFNHAGPRQNPSFVVSDFAKQFAAISLGKQEPVLHVGNIGVQRDFTDVRDVVRAYWELFDRSSSEFIFNVCSGTPVVVETILTLLQEISGRSVTINSEPDRVRAYDVPLVVASNERLRSATGWTPHIPLRQTIQDTYAYWQDVLKSAH